MSEVRALIEQLVDAGVDPITAAEVITRAAIAGAKDASCHVDDAAERRRAADRERKRAGRLRKSADVTDNPQMSADSADNEQKENTPHTPQKKNIYNPPIIPPGFEQFWEAFADKRGKEAALKVWKSRKLESIADEIVAGAERYAANRGPDRQFWKMPQGWLTAGRWSDEADKPTSQPIAPERQQVFVEFQSDEWAAWQSYNKAMRLMPMQCREGMGRYFPSKLPPSTSEAAA